MISYCQVSAFTQTPGHGNQAGVVLDASHLDEAAMQRAAKRLGVPETVFVTRHDDTTAWVRYYTPTQEIEFCGHATVALGLVLAQEGMWREGTLGLETLVGRIDLNLETQAGVPYRVWMNQRGLEVRPIDRSVRARLAEALGINERMIHRGLPMASASTGLWTAFVPLVDAFIVDNVEPDMDAIRALSEELGVTALHPYAPMNPNTLYTRDFAPLVGIPEDPVTGSSSGALVALLASLGALPRRGNRVVAYCLQGHALGTPGEVCVEVEIERDRAKTVRVGGCAVLDHEGRLS